MEYWLINVTLKMLNINLTFNIKKKRAGDAQGEEFEIGRTRV